MALTWAWVAWLARQGAENQGKGEPEECPGYPAKDLKTSKTNRWLPLPVRSDRQ